ncbi:DUF4429 domain-containing protein [Dehalococcoides mccartyi]|jgi:hypothetical protein|uniref:DUF4429 domain-containing protein n=1 Tax=Dehalococcoides mccartyi TaxID=61435 RepID=UPI00098F7AB0|nr:DUF4429 domain-containing protein [Dehalococcoides mccartyi]AQU06078.1 hypothetical protein B1777_05185 [Dehalococcoides mccartyi]AQU07522.1 hypothetical protein B1778_04990 [Dehalococcoides mccartyi]AQX75338.1 hypothetical protein B1776_04285 [Dehalococcoides mccartyi]AQY73913.1 hypothetical protein B1772_04595 [Dehalococcoides mccartyi]QBX64649.1 DUF4429 domain-containing protein [Dehalococcoides mccartyi]
MYEEPLFVARGINGQVELYNQFVRICRKGAMASIGLGNRGEKDISIHSLTSIQFKRPGTFTNGYIQFVFSGSTESKGGMWDAVQDENSVAFGPKQLRVFEELKTMVDDIRYQKQPKQSPVNQYAKPPVQNKSYDDLERLAELRDKGIITPSDFEAKKKQILGI